MSTGWDNIPDLGLEVDWQYTPKLFNKRKYGRIPDVELIKILILMTILPCKVATVTDVYKGTIKDVSAGGCRVLITSDLSDHFLCKVSFPLGRINIVSKCIVRHSQKNNDGFVVGLEFVDLNSDHKKFIAEMYSSKIISARPI